MYNHTGLNDTLYKLWIVLKSVKLYAGWLFKVRAYSTVRVLFVASLYKITNNNKNILINNNKDNIALFSSSSQSNDGMSKTNFTI